MPRCQKSVHPLLRLFILTGIGLVWVACAPPPTGQIPVPIDSESEIKTIVVPTDVLIPSTPITPEPILETATPRPTATAQPTQPPSPTPLPPLSLEAFFATTNREIDLRDGASGTHARIANIPVNTDVLILGRAENENWFLVGLDNDLTGWLPFRALDLPDRAIVSDLPIVLSRPPLPELLLEVDAITARDTSIYSAPRFDAPLIVENIPPGSPLLPTGRDDIGLWVSVGDQFGEIGWVLASSLQFAPTFQIMNLPQTVQTGPDYSYDWSQHIFEWGGQTHDMRHSAEMADMGMQWIKVQAKFHEDSQPRDVRGLIRQAHDRGFKILLAIPGQPYPDEIDFEAYVEYVAGIANLVDPPDAIEIWNEMNIDFEWPVGEIDPEQYVEELLKPAYTEIKKRNPNIMVISGAPAPTGFDNGTNAWADDRYIAGMVQSGATDYLDCIGVHYNAGATSPSVNYGHPAGDFYGWYYKPVLEVYFRAHNREKPLCITEIGYLTDNDIHNERMPANFWWAEQTTVEQHAEWLVEARNIAAESGYVRLFIIFNVDISHWDGRDPQTGYAMFRPLGNCPACEAFLADGTP